MSTTGQVLRCPKRVTHRDGKDDDGVFARALRELAAGRDTDPVGWLRSQHSRDRFETERTGQPAPSTQAPTRAQAQPPAPRRAAW